VALEPPAPRPLLGNPIADWRGWGIWVLGAYTASTELSTLAGYLSILSCVSRFISQLLFFHSRQPPSCQCYDDFSSCWIKLHCYFIFVVPCLQLGVISRGCCRCFGWENGHDPWAHDNPLAICFTVHQAEFLLHIPRVICMPMLLWSTILLNIHDCPWYDPVEEPNCMDEAQIYDIKYFWQ